MNNIVFGQNIVAIQNPMLLKAQSMGFKAPPKAKEPLKVAGRLASFIDTWKVLTGDVWVLNTIAGYQIPFKGEPEQARKPPEAVFSEEQTTSRKFNLCYRKVPSSHR